MSFNRTYILLNDSIEFNIHFIESNIYLIESNIYIIKWIFLKDIFQWTKHIFHSINTIYHRIKLPLHCIFNSLNISEYWKFMIWVKFVFRMIKSLFSFYKIIWLMIHIKVLDTWFKLFHFSIKLIMWFIQYSWYFIYFCFDLTKWNSPKITYFALVYHICFTSKNGQTFFKM